MLPKTDKTRGTALKFEPKRLAKTPEFGILLLALLALIVLFNPFSGGIVAVAPALSFLAAFALFMVPGLVLAVALSGPDLAGLARIPVAFALSVGVFGLAALPAPILIKNFTLYLITCAIILVLSLTLAVMRLVRSSTVDQRRFTFEPSTTLLWAPFLLLVGMLARISAANVPGPAEDIWIYLSYVRDFLGSGRLTGGAAASRLVMNGWLPEQSMLSWVSGLSPIPLVLEYLAPTLVVVSLLALYALARTLLRNEKAALVISALTALFFLVGLGSPYFHSVLAPAGEFVNHITEDKFVARYVFLPVALSLAIIFVRGRTRRDLGLFFFICLSVVIVHPLGLVFIGVPIAGFGLLHLARRWRDREARRGIGGLWLALLIITAPPALYLLVTRNPLLSRLDATDPNTANNLIGTWEYQRRLLEIGQGSYVMHPSILLDPAMLVAFVLGVPFLIWKIKRAEDSLAAQLLLGTLAFVPVLTFVPYTATPISRVIGPWLLYRLTWPLLLASLLTVGWMCWEALSYVESGLGAFSLTRSVAPFLPLVFVGCLLADAVPLALTGLRAAADQDKIAQDDSSCLDPTFSWLQDTIPASGKRNIGIMAPRAENSCIKAYVASADILGMRGQIASQAQQDLEDFYYGPTLGPDALQILQRHKIKYVMVSAASPLKVQLDHLPGFTPMNNPGERYRVYEITGQTLEPTPTIVANGDLNNQEWETAIEAYNKALDGGTADRTLTYLGLGRAYMEEGQYAEAAKSYEAAVGLDPESSANHELLASAYDAAGDKDQARTEFERAVGLDPEDVDLRLRYGQFLIPVDQQKAMEQYQAVVEMYPKVPDYRVKFGAALLLVGDPKAADQQFERAAYMSPLSAKLWADIGNANLLSGRPDKAIEYYDTALELDPNSQLYALNLGKAHAQLSTLNGDRNQEHFREAEALFKRVDELSHLPWEADQREAARIALGDLYLDWNRPDDAAAAYQQALKLNPDSNEAKEKLDGLQQGRR